jgi:hypothetical protein
MYVLYFWSIPVKWSTCAELNTMPWWHTGTVHAGNRTRPRYLCENSSWYPLDKMCGPQKRFGTFGEYTNQLPLPGIHPPFLGRRARSPFATAYWLTVPVIWRRLNKPTSRVSQKSNADSVSGETTSRSASHRFLASYNTHNIISVFPTIVPEPNTSSPHFLILFLRESFQYNPHSCPKVFQIFSFGLQSKIMHVFAISSVRATWPPNSPSVICSCNYAAPHYAFSPGLSGFLALRS